MREQEPHRTEETRTGGPGGADVAVVDVWTFRSDQSIGDIDIAGYSVEATDGGIGKIDEATYEAGGSFVIVDTGPWIFGKKVMLPAGVVQNVDPEAETVYVNRSKDEIKNAPEYDETTNREDDEYRERLGGYYGERDNSIR